MIKPMTQNTITNTTHEFNIQLIELDLTTYTCNTYTAIAQTIQQTQNFSAAIIPLLRYIYIYIYILVRIRINYGFVSSLIHIQSILI